MKIVILQPTFLPWLGYFDLIDQSDIFVFLDSVQFNKRSWQQRNKIKTPKGLEWVTIPVKVKGLSEQIIAETILQDAPSFFSKVQNQLKFNYGNSPFFGSYFDSFLDAFHFGINQSNLCDLNINLILWFAEKLNKTTWVKFKVNNDKKTNWVVGSSYFEPSFCRHTYSRATDGLGRILSYTTRSNLENLMKFID